MARIEEEEKELNHFSHEEHPLILKQVDKKQGVDHVEIICYGCHEQISEPEAYICSHCDFFLHKKCAKLPGQITHPMHSQHPLVLLQEPPYESRICMCNACRRDDWKFFTYHCSLCHFDLDVFCSNMERRFDHTCHEHPLILQNRPATFRCNACRREYRDSSYFCSTCPFWIHKTCASLPDSVNHKLHNHPLLLANCLPFACGCNYKCSDCSKLINLTGWVFYCGPCRYAIHFGCFLPTNERDGELHSENDELILQKKELVNLPMEDPTQNLLSRIFPQKTEANILHPTHNHMLFLAEEKQTQNDDEKICSSGEAGQTLLCDGCIEPIIPSDPHYKCTSCSYFLHAACKNLPTQLQILEIHGQHNLALDRTLNLPTGAFCNVCPHYCNGIVYTCSDACEFRACVKCIAAALHSSVVHKAHKHILKQAEDSNKSRSCDACGYMLTSSGIAFGCKECKYYLGHSCYLLPPTIRHKLDKHLVILMFPPYHEHPDDFYCEICEKRMNRNHWMYHCRECDQSFHPNCLPQVKYKSRKLGLHLHVKDHRHPLISVVEGTYISFCEDCGRKVYEHMAFECSPCRFYLCMRCVARRERSKEKNIASQ